MAESRERLEDLGFSFAVATVDHGLRPEAVEEAATVAVFAEKAGLRHRSLRWSDGFSGANLQAAARAARYRLLAEAARAFGADAVLLGHHQDDQIETHWMAVARREGASRRAGMRAWRALEPGLSLGRPLLDRPKSLLLASLRKRGLRGTLDPSNEDPRFWRARLRGRLAALSPEERRDVLSEIKAAAAERDRIEQAVAAKLPDVEISDTAILTLNIGALLEGEGGLELLSRALSAGGGAARPASGPEVARLLLRIGHDGPERAATLGGCRIERKGATITVAREYGRHGPPTIDLVGTSGPIAFDDRFDLVALPVAASRIVPFARLGRGNRMEGTLPVAVDAAGVVVAAHRQLLTRLGPGISPMKLRERVSWRLARDLPVSQFAAKEPPQVGKDFAADYLPWNG